MNPQRADEAAAAAAGHQAAKFSRKAGESLAEIAAEAYQAAEQAALAAGMNQQELP